MRRRGPTPCRVLRASGCALLSALLLAAAGPGVARAQDAAAVENDGLRERLREETFTLNADRVSYEQERDVYEADGNVHVVQPSGRELRADWLVFNATTRVGVAMGNVELREGEDVVTAEFVALDLDSLVSLARKAQIDSPEPGFEVQGDAIERVGVDSYSVHDGLLTTCRCPEGEEPRPWEIEVEDADVRVGGYAVGRNLRFRTFGVPVLWVPWVIFPVKTERQTGFLLPSFALSGRNGSELETPFFIAAGERVNLTLTPAWLSKRGAKGSAELEYVFGQEAGGTAFASALPGDDDVDRDDVETPFSDDRWAWRWRHEQPLGDVLGLEHGRFGMDARRFSDNQYPLDFDDDLPEQSRNARYGLSSSWLAWGRDGFHGAAVATLVDDLQSPDDLDRDDWFLQRLPDVQASTVPRALGPLPLYAGLQTRYTYFHALDAERDFAAGGVQRRPVNGQFFDTGRDGLFSGQEPDALGFSSGDQHRDDFDPTLPLLSRTEGDGRFQEGELLADRGHRIDLYPHLALPFRFGVVETLSEVGFRETIYLAEYGDNDRREIWTGRFDMRTRFGRGVELFDTPLQHELEPRVAFAAVSTPGQDLNPLFVPASSVRADRLISGDLRLLTRDPSDRVPDARLLQTQLAQRIYRRDALGSDDPSLLAELVLGSGYDFLDSELARLFARGGLQPSRWQSLGFEIGYDPREDEVGDASAWYAWSHPDGHAFRASYRYLRQLTIGFEDFNRDDEIFDDFEDDFDRVSQLDAAALWSFAPWIQLFGNGYLSLESSGTSGGELGFVLLSDCKCWDLVTSIEHRVRPSDTRLQISLRLAGLGRRQQAPGFPDLRVPGL